MGSTRLDRINELYHKQKAGTLTPAEKKEQARLRQEYIATLRANLTGTLDNTTIAYPDGRRENLGERAERNAGKRKNVH